MAGTAYRLLNLAKERPRLLISRARDAQGRRDWTEAERLWRRVADRAPRDTGAWVQLGNMLNELGRHAEAIDAFRHAGRLDPDLAHAPAGVAGVHERAGRWNDAGKAWVEAIELLSRGWPGDRIEGELAHALDHVALSARNTGGLAKAQHILESSLSRFPDLLKRPGTMAVRAKLLPAGRSGTGATFLRDFVDLLPSPARERAAAMPGVRNGDPFGALVEIAPFLEAGRTDPAFLRIAADVYENGHLWREAARLAEWLIQVEPDDIEHIVRAFHAAATGRRLADARRLARRHARITGELLLIHRLAELYDAVFQSVRARLLFRFLTRRWPHSRWHACRYIVATAATRSLPLADRLVRRELAAGRHDRDLDQAYCRSALAAGHYEEARMRLIHHLNRHDDHDADVLLGYAIANTRGLDEATGHFRTLAARDLQSLSAMAGAAHMAMRQRDLPLAFARWGDIATVHPNAANAHVEQARCTYDMGDIDGAIHICRLHMRDHDSDVGMGEFYTWLLAVNGRYEEALPAIAAVLAASGPNWQAVDQHIICSSQLDTLDRDWDAIAAMIPASDTGDALSRFYHVIRILIAVGRRDLAQSVLLGRDAPLAQLPWAAPYLRAAALAGDAREVMERRWSTTAALIRHDPSDRLDAMPDAEVNALLSRGEGALPTVHVVNKFEQPRGGSELHALDLAAQIGRYAKTRLWAPEMPHPEFTARHGVRSIDPSIGACPRGGILVLIGVYFDVARWIGHARPSRIIFLYNTFEAPALFIRIEEAWRLTGVRPELLYCSDLMGRETGLPGRFEPSPTNLDLFSPSTEPRPASRPFTLGRHSRDVPEKHGRDDWKVYQEVSALGGESALLGGTCMAGAFPELPRLRLLAARGTGIPNFLHRLDAYFYRTSTWVEPWGRVVIEAMACGLPVLVHSAGGYAQAIEHEVNGLLFDTTAEAVRLIRRLAKEPGLRLRLGQEARRSACALLGPAELARVVAFYLMDDAEPRP